MSAASFLGISGSIALYGYDGFLYSIGFLVAWLVALLLVAELLRNSGRYTMADQLAYRMRQTPVRCAAATSTIVVSIFYLLAQMVGAGALVGLLLGVDQPGVKNLVIVGVGVLMIIYVTFGGMKGTTWVQIVKAVLLMVGSLLITILVLAQFGFNLSELLGAAAEKSGKGEAFLEPGLLYGKDLVGKIDFLSLGLALVLGTAGLPHILIRFYTTPTAHAARKSVLWAIGLIGGFYLMTLVLGFGAAALVDTGQGSQIQTSSGNAASPLLAQAVGGGEGTLGRLGAARVDLRGRVRHDSGGGRRAHPDLRLVGGARLVRERVQEGEGDGKAGTAGGADRGLRHRHRGDLAGHPGAAAEHRVPGGAGVCRGCLGQPARLAVQPVLAAVQHHRGRP